MSGDTKRRGMGERLLPWVGLPLAFAGLVTYFEWFVRYPALRDFPWVNLPIVLLGVTLAGFATWRAFRGGGRIVARIATSVAFILALAVGGLFVTYVFHLSYGVPGPSAAGLAVERIPDLTLENAARESVSLGAFRGRKVVIVFYRGYW